MLTWIIFLLFGYFSVVLCVPKPILGGTDAKPFTYPYQVALSKTSRQFCGGSIISKNWILTAGHCMYKTNVSEVVIIAGSISLSSADAYLYKGKYGMFHEGYNPDITGQLHDIYLLAPTEEIVMIKNVVWPIQLGIVDPPDNSIVTVTGWGYSTPDRKATPNIMQVVTLTTSNIQKCMTYNPLDPCYPQDIVTKKNICTQDFKGKSTCQGDSGGPLAYKNTLAGIPSFGPDDCVSNKPFAFTSVASYRDWIIENTDLYC